MQAGWVLVGDIGVGAFDTAGEVGAHEQVENAVNAVRRDPLAAGLGNRLGDVVGGGWLVEAGKGIEHRSAHVGPLFAALNQPPSGGIVQRWALMKLVGMC